MSLADTWDGKCPKHGVAMIEVPLTTRRFSAPLHRCPLCTAEWRAAVEKARRGPPQFIRGRVVKQRTLPPVIMSERWP